MNDHQPLCEAFVRVAELCEARGEHPINQYATCWECTVDERWKLAVNGHREPKRSNLAGIDLEPFHCYVTYNGWPAFIFTPYGGGGAAGAGANENTFIDAVIAATRKARKP